MTNTALKQYPWICRQLQIDQNRLHDLHDQAIGMGIQVSCMLHGSGVSDRVGRLCSEIAALERTIGRLEEQKARIECFIQSISNFRLRKTFILHYQKGWKWKDVACEMRCSEDSAKKACYRYMKNYPTTNC